MERKRINSIILALNAMQTSIDRIGTDSKPSTVMVLLSTPVVEQSLVRILSMSSIKDDLVLTNRFVNVEISKWMKER